MYFHLYFQFPWYQYAFSVLYFTQNCHSIFFLLFFFSLSFDFVPCTTRFAFCILFPIFWNHLWRNSLWILFHLQVKICPPINRRVCFLLVSWERFWSYFLFVQPKGIFLCVFISLHIFLITVLVPLLKIKFWYCISSV